MVSTDHCPFCFKAQKEMGLGDFSKIPNGMPGVEHRMDLLHQGVVDGHISRRRWVELACATPARMFGLYPRKGTIAPGSDADVVVYDPNATQVLSAATHHMNVDYSGYEGKEITGKVRTVLSRGRIVIDDGEYRGAAGHGRFLKRDTCQYLVMTPMDFGLVLQTDPPGSTVVDLLVHAEELGFSHGWTFDSHVLWQEPFVIYSQVLARTSRLVVGPMVTNPATRDWTVIASLFATLNEMFGNRTVCGIGRGDSAVRVQGRKPTTLARLEGAMHVIRELAEGRPVDVEGTEIRIPWVPDGARLPVWVAGYGPKALELIGALRGRLHPAARRSVPRRVDGQVGARGGGGGGPRPRGADDLRGRAGLRRRRQRDDGARPRAVPLVRRDGRQPRRRPRDPLRRESGAVPAELTDYIKAREGYDYSHHGKAGNPSTDFVPDEVVDRFCLLGPPAAQLERLAELRELGVDQFAIYAMHDAREATIEAYGAEVIPALS